MSSPVKQGNDNTAQRVRRPFLLKVLAAGFLVLAWLGFLRLEGTLADWQVLAGYLSTTLLIYISASGAIYGLAGLVSALALWFGTRHASMISRASAAGVFVWYWADRIWLTHSPFAQTNLVFALIASILAFLFALLVPTLPAVKNYLAKK
jgi:hypothetical protein